MKKLSLFLLAVVLTMQLGAVNAAAAEYFCGYGSSDGSGVLSCAALCTIPKARRAVVNNWHCPRGELCFAAQGHMENGYCVEPGTCYTDSDEDGICDYRGSGSGRNAEGRGHHGGRHH